MRVTTAVLDDQIDELRRVVAAAATVVPVGSRTQWSVGGPAPEGREVAAPSGVVAYDPAELTVTVGAGTAFAHLREQLAEAGQECPLDPRDPRATVGGVLACGLSGPRRLRVGPVRDAVLEVRFVTGDGRLVKGGGPTVKNVSGYDLPRLLVGSLGTLGVIVRVTLRCRPLPAVRRWATGNADPFEVRRRLYRPSCIAWDGSRAHCLLEGHAADVDAELGAAGLAPGEPPPWPNGPYRGRVSVLPSALPSLGLALSGVPGLRWLGEVGVGTVHVAGDDPEPLREARRLAEDSGGWMLREAGDGLEPFGRSLPNPALAGRIKAALDPTGKLNPGRLPR